jgi:CRISPR-associated protein Csx17
VSELILDGCTPEPLMGYLKALGVLRLVSESKQADPDACGYWRNGTFALETKLDRDGLLKFFREDYKPTPIVAPWGARSGFYPGPSESSARKALTDIMNAQNERVGPFKDAIVCIRAILGRLGFQDKVKDEDKLRLMRACRAELPDDLLLWIDAAYVLTNNDRTFPPILGTGGNEGSGSYVSGFAQMVVEAVVNRKWDDSVEISLFEKMGASAFSDQTPGHFSPEDLRGVNPWDYLFALEGCCAWASGLARRANTSTGSGMAAFPFTVQPIAVGGPGLCGTDGKRPKTAKRDLAELWLPLWDAPTGFAELLNLLCEGRVSNGQRSARTALDFAVAASGLGVDRGISAFQRMTFLMRNGQTFYATSLGRISVKQKPAIFLVEAVRPWLDGLRRECRDNATPMRFASSLRRVESATFDYCKYGGADRLADILAALGATERELAVGDIKPEKRLVKPLARLSVEWLKAAMPTNEDDAMVFRLARGLAFLDTGTKGTGRVRRYLEPVEQKGESWTWGQRGGHVVWSGGNLARNLGAILARRLQDAEKNGEPMLPIGSPFPVSLADIAAFLTGDIDDTKLEELLWGLSLVEPGSEWEVPKSGTDAELPRAYALLKLTLIPGRLEWAKSPNGEPLLRLNRPGTSHSLSGIAVKAEPAIPAKLRAGEVHGACEVAARRLRSSGFSTVGGFLADGARRVIDWSAGGARPERLLAALLFPIPDYAVNQLASLVLRRPSSETFV